MSRLVRFSNNAVSTLAAGITSSATSLTVTTGEGARFPSISGSQFFMSTLLKQDGTTEIVKVTARSGDTFTIVRAADEVAGVTAASAFSAGDRIQLRLTGKAIGDEFDRLESVARIGSTVRSSNYVATEADSGNLIRVGTASGAVQITLPAISGLADDFDLLVSKATTDSNQVAIVPSGTDVINGAASYSLSSSYQSAWLIADRINSVWTAINSTTGSSSTGTFSIDTFTGSGTAGPFTLSGDPANKSNTSVYVGGVYQQKSTYTLSGTALTLGGTVASGVIVEVVWGPVVGTTTLADLSVTTAKVVDGAVTAAKLGTGAAASNLGSYVSTFNTRSGAVTLTSGDVTTALTYTPANLVSPTFTGLPGAPTALADTNTTQLATTAFVIGQAAATTPLMNGSAAIGTSVKYARADHVHPSDTSLAALASPAFTGTPTAPTATAGTNTTQIATTAFVSSAVSAATAGVASFNTRTGAVTLTSLDVSGALGFTPYNATNPNGYTANAGTVTSVALTLPSIFSVSGSPVTVSGTLSATLASQTANLVFASPNGTAGAPTFRSLVAADIPTLNQNTTGTAANVSGTVAIANGGTGATTAAVALTNLGAYAASNPNGYTSNTGTVTSVTGTAPVSVANGTTTPAISIAQATSLVPGYLSSTDWSTFNGKAPLASPAFTGTPTAPTATAGTSTTQLATTAFVSTAVAAVTNAVSSFNTRTGAITLNSSDVTTALGYTPYNSTNPSSYTSNLGTVTSVGLSLPSMFTVSGSPVTASGTLSATLASQLANVFFASPNGAAGSPVFRSITAADVPTLNQNTTGTAANVTGTVAVANGGTGSTTASGALTNLGAAPLASPTLTGTPAAPTAAADTNTTQLATTAFVAGQAGSATPVMNGTAAVGTSLRYARQDHVHPSDTTRAPLASPTFTGTPAAPTATSGTNTTQLATTAFVQAAVASASGTATFFNVKTYGAYNNGTNATTTRTAIQAAIDAAAAAGGGTVYLPSGTYLIDAALTLSSTQWGVTIRGDNHFGTIIQQSSSTSKIINNNATFTKIIDLRFDYSAATPLAGATAIYSSGSNTHIQSIYIAKCDIGIEMTAGAAQMADNFQIFDYQNVGIYLHDINDIFFSKFILNANSSTKGALGGIRLVNSVQAALFTDGDIILGQYNITMDGTYTRDLRPAYNYFTNVYFDSASYGSSINNTVETNFNSCWFSAGRTSTGYPGLTINTADSIRFTSCQFFNNGQHGCLVTANAKRIGFNGCTFESNGATSGTSGHGLVIAAGTTDFIIKDCIAHNGLYTGTQGWGILVNSGASDRYIISGNLVSGNATGGMSDGGTGTNKSVSANF